jgi:hypothetical protein
MDEIMIRLADVKEASMLSRLNGTFNKSRLSPYHYAARLSDPNRVDIRILAEMDGTDFHNLPALELYRAMGHRLYDISLSKKLGKPTAHGK